MKRFFQKIFTLHPQSKNRSKRLSKRKGLDSGFTLIELLVAALIASFMVVVMLSFLVGVLDSDRKETAKSNAQEELQAAISYISDDLQEAIYIYGSTGLAAINSELPHSQAGAGNECAPTAGSNTCTPILVFWKRLAYNPSSRGQYAGAGGGTEFLGCMPYAGSADLAACRASSPPFGREMYVYSLVAYYLKDDSANPDNSGWSNTARILRWEIKGGYAAYCSNNGAINSDGCPASALVATRGASPLIVAPTILTDNTQYFILPSQGFNSPDFLVEGAIDNWKKFANFDFGNTAVSSRFVTLVDFIDDTAYDATQGGNLAATGTGTTTAADDSAIKITIGRNNIAGGNFDCDNPSVGVGSSVAGTITQRVPADFNDPTSNPSGLSSFYMCVAPSRVTARIYMRGNAIARLTTPTVARSQRVPQINSGSFFPVADVRSFGRSAINLGKN